MLNLLGSHQLKRNLRLLKKTRELKTSQERIEGSSTATQSCSVSFHCLFEMQGRANLLQTEFNRAFQPGSQTEAFFDFEKKTIWTKNRWLEQTTKGQIK